MKVIISAIFSSFYSNYHLLIMLLLFHSNVGRGKMKKFIGPLLLGLGGKIFAVVPLFLVGIAILAVKALIVSKVALFLAILLAAGKMMGGGGGGGGGLGLLGKLGGAGAGLLGGLSAGGNGGGNSYSNGNSGGYASSGSTGGGWSSGSGNSAYPYARSYDEAQDLPYSGQVQQTE